MFCLASGEHRRLTAGPRTDVNVVRLAGRRMVRDAARVRRARVRVAAHPLHAKTFVAHGEWFTVESMNLDNRSMALKDEATWMVPDRTLGDEMNRIFLDDLRHPREIIVEAFRACSWLQRIAERGANWLTRLR
jgi:phosphatidylserine/phosphatidylglycerophosphate/cardiolipin synthase-like enzyme